MANMANVLGLIFANMHEQSVADLTKKAHTCKCALRRQIQNDRFPAVKYGKQRY